MKEPKSATPTHRQPIDKVAGLFTACLIVGIGALAEVRPGTLLIRAVTAGVLLMLSVRVLLSLLETRTMDDE